MGSSQSFGNVADMRYVHIFSQDMGEIQIENSMGVIADFAAKAGISLRMERRDRSVAFVFEKVADYLVIRDEISTWDRVEWSTHTEEFRNCDPAYVNTWKYEARKILNDAGIVHHVDERDNEISFNFQSFGALSMFQTLRDTGYIDRKAETTMRIGGPAAPGAMPY